MPERRDANRPIRRLNGPLRVAGATLLLLALGAAGRAQVIKVGSFAKAIGAGQVVAHGLGQTPKALILWTDGKTNESFSASFLYAFGMTTGPTNSKSVAIASQNGAGPSSARRRLADKAITIVNFSAAVPGGGALAEADLQSWDATSFTLLWTTNDVNAYVIHFMAIGGSGVSAKVVPWTMQATTGPQTVNGVGFQPDVVLHAHLGHDFTAASGNNANDAHLGLGAMDRSGGQWANAVLALSGAATSDTQRGQQTNGCLYDFDNTNPTPAVQKKAAFSSMDADGFTVNFTNATSASQGQVISLALKGVSAKAGYFLKSTTVPPAAAYVQKQSYWTATTVTSGSVALPAVAAGNLIVVSLNYNLSGSVTASVSDDRGNTYRRALGPTDFGTMPERMYAYYATNVTGGATNITVTLSGGNSNGWLEIYATEFAGMDTVDPLDQTAAAVGSGNPVLTGSVTTTSPDEILYGFCDSQSGSITVSAPFSERSKPQGNPTADRAVTSIGTYGLVGTVTSGNWGCHLLSFRHAGAKQPVTGVGFSPDAVLLTSVQDLTRLAPVAETRLGLGAFDSGFNRGSSALADRDGVATTNVQGIDKTSRAFVKVNNNTPAIDAEAVPYGIDPSGFTLSWTANDAVATEILYLALAGPRPPSYRRFRRITIPASSLGASCTASLTSFPVLVTLANDLDLRRASDGGFVQSANGYDIVFTDEHNNPLDHEIEQYASAAGGATLVAWVRVPTLSILGPTTIYLRYDNASVTTPTANPAGVWAPGFMGVWHLTGSFADSTPNANTGANNGTTDLAGQIARSRDFNGSTNEVTVANSSSLQAFTSTVTAQAWINPDSLTNWRTVLSKFAGVGDLYVVFFDGDLVVRLNPVTNGGDNDWFTGYGGFTTGAWQHLVVTYDGATVRAYRNGVEVAALAATGTLGLSTNGQPFYVGNNTEYPGEYFDGRIDEVRLSSPARSHCWVETEYENQIDPGTFYTLDAPTAVELLSFEARGVSSGVELTWETASELGNLGFHLHRSLAEEGPYERITASLIPGLGSSPVGASYSYLDAGLVPGQRYHYRLEDVDASSASTHHGPVAAVVPAPSPPEGDGEGEGGGDGAEREGDSVGDGSPQSPPESPEESPCPSWLLSSLLDLSTPVRCTPHGDPDAVSLSVLGRSSRSVDLELRTGGFWSVSPRDPVGPSPEGSSGPGLGAYYVQGFDTPGEADALALPLRRALVDAVVGKQVRLASVEALEERRFPGLRPTLTGHPQIVVSRDGTVRASRRGTGAAPSSAGASAAPVARLAGTLFQGETKRAVLELSPLRDEAGSGGLVLATRVRVRLLFAGVEAGETGAGGTGRRARAAASPEVLVQLHATRRGLHAVRFEDALPGRPRGLATARLRLQRDGEAVAFRVEPSPEVFGPGSRLFFHVDREARSTDFTGEVAYELVKSAGEAMGTVVGAPEGAAVTTASLGFVSQEVNRIYQSGLLEAEDVWLWEAVPSAAFRTKVFVLEGVDTASAVSGRVVVYLQGASESGTVVDHHVRVKVNGAEVGEASFAGMRPYRLEAEVPASVFREGSNEVEVRNVGDTGVASLVFLDRYEVSPPRKPQASEGVFVGRWTDSGTVEVSGLEGPTTVLDVTEGGGEPAPRWLTGVVPIPGGVRFRAEAGRRYLAVSSEGLSRPRIVQPPASTLRSASNRADYLLIAPQGFLSVADPLLVHRASQGLAVKAVSLEEIGREFGHGKPSGEAIRSFVSYAYHEWARPSPRYVVLLGDATYDPRWFSAGTTLGSPLPALWGKTSWVWTAKDPVLGAVNGEDEVPDVAVGRMPATTREEAERLIGKLLAWEGTGQGIDGKALLVADNPDAAGDFEWDVAAIRAEFLGGRETEVLKIGELGAGTRPAVQAAFDGGLGLASYVGHGGAAVWASESVWTSWDATSLRAQSRQPLLLTLNCLNGYFVATNFESLSESLVKAEGRGAIAAFSPSGLSVDGPAHQYHRALMGELVRGSHERLGDAVLAAQRTYAETGLMPELLSIYHLFGDPATRIR